MKNKMKKFDSLFLEEDAYSNVSNSTIVEVRIAKNYIDVVGFSYDVNMVNPYFDECEGNFYITMPYIEAQAFARLLGYTLYHVETVGIGFEVPFETRSRCVDTCQREIWVNPENNPFEYENAENLNEKGE